MFSNAIPKQGDFSGLSVAIWRQTGWRSPLCLQFWPCRRVQCRRLATDHGEGGIGWREDAVASRVGERWDALIKGDYARAYEYLSPASRDVAVARAISEAYAERGLPRSEDRMIDCDTERCKVKLSVTYDHRLMKGVTTPLEETWVFDKGKPWFVYRG